MWKQIYISWNIEGKTKRAKEIKMQRQNAQPQYTYMHNKLYRFSRTNFSEEKNKRPGLEYNVEFEKFWNRGNNRIFYLKRYFRKNI